MAGNTKVVKAYGSIKDNTDSGQFRAIQKAGMFALGHPSITEAICEKYSRRFDLLVTALNDIGFSVSKPKGTFFCYVECPSGTEAGIIFDTATEFSEFLLKDAQISTVPWDDAGKYVRFSVTFEAGSEDEEIVIIKEIKRRLAALNLRF